MNLKSFLFPLWFVGVVAWMWHDASVAKIPTVGAFFLQTASYVLAAGICAFLFFGYPVLKKGLRALWKVVRKTPDPGGLEAEEAPQELSACAWRAINLALSDAGHPEASTELVDLLLAGWKVHKMGARTKGWCA